MRRFLAVLLVLASACTATEEAPSPSSRQVDEVVEDAGPFDPSQAVDDEETESSAIGDGRGGDDVTEGDQKGLLVKTDEEGEFGPGGSGRETDTDQSDPPGAGGRGSAADTGAPEPISVGEEHGGRTDGAETEVGDSTERSVRRGESEGQAEESRKLSAARNPPVGARPDTDPPMLTTLDALADLALVAAAALTLAVAWTLLQR